MDIYPDNPMRIMFNLYAKMCNKHRSNNPLFPQILEMDWIRIWYQQPCDKDLTISDQNQIPKEPEVFNLINGLSVLYSDKLDVQLFNEKTGLDMDSTLRDQDYKITCAIRNGLNLTYACNSRLNIVLEGFVDFRLRDFYKENYTWSIWNNKGDGRIATIFKGGIGYRW